MESKRASATSKQPRQSKRKPATSDKGKPSHPLIGQLTSNHPPRLRPFETASCSCGKCTCRSCCCCFLRCCCARCLPSPPLPNHCCSLQRSRLRASPIVVMCRSFQLSNQGRGQTDGFLRVGRNLSIG